MLITSEFVDIPVDGRAMRTFVASPVGEHKYPGILCYSDIFQLTGATLRSCVRLAGYGFIVAVPEIYHRIEPAGTVLAFDDAGRDRGLADAAQTPVADFDADCRAALDYLVSLPQVAQGRIGAAGWCIGGHLAFRAALQHDVKATVCFYATGVDTGRLGKDADAGSLARAAEIKGELMMVWGTADPHIPAPGRQTIRQALDDKRVSYVFHEFPAAHAFMRDEGPRYDPEVTDAAHNAMVAHFRRSFA